MKKRTYVTAGLVAVLGLGAAGVVGPVDALAEELPQEEVSLVEGSDLSDGTVEPNDNASSADENDVSVVNDENNAVCTVGDELTGDNEAEDDSEIAAVTDTEESSVESDNGAADDEGSGASATSEDVADGAAEDVDSEDSEKDDAGDSEGNGETDVDGSDSGGINFIESEDSSAVGSVDDEVAEEEPADSDKGSELVEEEPANDEADALLADADYESTHQNMYRLYNPNSGEHFYTSSLAEALSVCEAGWRWEGVGWVAPVDSATPVYRLYNPNAGDHHYTASAEERDYLVSAGWRYEGVGWYSDDSGSAIDVWREYNPNAASGAHNFTTSSAEDASLVSAGWTAEGVAWRATDGSALPIQGRWVVTSAWGSLERYWLDSTASIAKGRLVDPTTERDAGAGYYAYAKSDGAVVRGKWDNGAGYVYLADNDGALASVESDGWLVTGDYDDGALQRYYMSASVHAARSGFFVVEGYGSVYGLGGEGYVMRGKSIWGTYMMLADNDGKLADSAGWLVTAVYDGTTERYYLELVPGIGDFYGAVLGFFTVDDSDYYAFEDKGYTARNGWYLIASKGKWYQADNDAKLTVLVGNKVGYQNPSGYPQVSAYDVVLPSYATGYYTYVMSCQIKPDATRSDCVETFISAAMSYLGTTWVDNCASYPGDTIDCSGLVMEALYACGMSLDGVSGGDFNPYSKYWWNHSFANTWRLNNTFMPVSLSSIQRGDIIYFSGHVAIYLGDGQILDASSVSGSTTVHSYYSSMYGGALGAARPFV